MKRSRIRRKTPLKPGKKRLRPRGRRGERMKKAGEVFGPHAEMVRMLNCDRCGAPGPSDPHHRLSRGSGHGDFVDGDGNLLALCYNCHSWVHGTAEGMRWNKSEAAINRAKEHGEAFHEITGGRFLAAQETE